MNPHRNMGRIFSTTGQTPMGRSGPKTGRAFSGTALLLLFLLISISFLSCSSETTLKGTPVPTPGMKLEEKDRIWRGGAIGAALGNPVEGKITDILIRAAREGAKDNVPLVYVSLDGVQRVEIHPSKGGSKDNCRLIRVQVYQEGTLYRDTLEEVCW
ncbi:MAG TPA: hypothetical protein VK564_06650 [Thermodesulfobacteriota bacterium]|nr:hypothetical protein [Thermodesulfobacteriota bacterium]